MRREAEERNMAAERHSMLSRRDSIANRLPVLPDPYVVLDSDVQDSSVQKLVVTRAPTNVKEPDLETVAEASQESDGSKTSSDSELGFDSVA
jgi:hypothetical protein